MEAQLAQFLNKGMYQDVSISKATNDFAFENYNIRITSLKDNTLLSVTNEILPKPLQVNIVNTSLENNRIYIPDEDYSNKLKFRAEKPVETSVIIEVVLGYESHDGTIETTAKKNFTILKGETDSNSLQIIDAAIMSANVVTPKTSSSYAYYVDYLSAGDPIPDYTSSTQNYLIGEYRGHTILNDYIVVFTQDKETSKNYIYRLTINDSIVEGIILYDGYLNINKIVETLPYYESNKVQKVYWTDGENPIRFINILNNSIDRNNDSQFDINPTINTSLECTVEKKYEGLGVFPAGVIQYFISYYNDFGAESNIAYNSPLQYINFNDRGASPEETVACHFELKLSNIDTSFNNVRVYSIKRSSYNGEVDARLVADMPINNTTLTVVDTNTNQELIDPHLLLFLGGDSIIAETITQKDNTLFVGNVNSKTLELDKIVTDYPFKKYDENTGMFEAASISFQYKQFPINPKDGYYSYENETFNDSSKIRTFKTGEIYRFAIQFQNKEGSWTIPHWIGDKKCELAPFMNIDHNIVNVATALFIMPKVLTEGLKDVYSNYRILMAETSKDNRSVVAQGVVSPTMFNYKDRCENGPYAISSWIMRPRGGNVNYKHLDNTGTMYDVLEDNTLLRGDNNVEIQGLINRSSPTGTTYLSGQQVITLGMQRGYKINVKVAHIVTTDSGKEEDYLLDTYVSGSNWRNALTQLLGLLESIGIVLEGITYDSFLSFVKQGVFPNSPSWTNTNDLNVPYHTWLNYNIYFNGFVMSQTTQLIGDMFKSADIKKKRNNYYIDNSILTFHSPELEDENINLDDLKFRIVGLVPLTANYSDVDINVNSGYYKGAYVNKSIIKNNKNISENPNILVSDYLYTDAGIVDLGIQINKIQNYNIYMWNKQGAIVATNDDVINKDDFPQDSTELKQKTIANLNYSAFTNYHIDKNIDNIWTKPIKNTQIFNSDNIEFKKLDFKFKTTIYSGNHDKLLTFDDKSFYFTVTKEDIHKDIKVFDPVRIKYKSTPHIVFSFDGGEDNIFPILPYLENNDEEKEDLQTLYEDVGNSNFIWGNIQYQQDSIKEITCRHPYLYLGELYRDIPYNSLYGGTSPSALQSINWIPISNSTPIDSSITNTDGDTYYQRWDCLKTYPYTEEDLNKVVDITSFMVETHINLEGRYDKNRGVDNILNSRPTNFNLKNDVYSQENNYFSYNILDNKFKGLTYENQIIFSLEKTPNSKIDMWANLSLTNALNLNGSNGKITKLFNLNDTLLAFQEKAISTINFNNRTALSTESGVPIEIANSGKVNGYNIVTENIGCQNKQSVCLGVSGLYFIDDYNKGLYRLNKEGLDNISETSGMSVWFKTNLTGKEIVSYDSLTKDVYIINNNSCLNFNEKLNAFISFYKYNTSKSVFNINANSYLLNNNLTFSEMFKGDYSKDYYVLYKINPEPLTDKIFTNIEYLADCLPINNKVDEKGLKHNLYPFEHLEVWNEYQKGSISLIKRKYPYSSKKFRIWRADIPRDESNKRDRIRNPWIYLKLLNNSSDQKKTVFHNLIVKYYK